MKNHSVQFKPRSNLQVCTSWWTPAGLWTPIWPFYSDLTFELQLACSLDWPFASNMALGLKYSLWTLIWALYSDLAFVLWCWEFDIPHDPTRFCGQKLKDLFTIFFLVDFKAAANKFERAAKTRKFVANKFELNRKFVENKSLKLKQIKRKFWKFWVF